jgi:hypothetical protein
VSIATMTDTRSFRAKWLFDVQRWHQLDAHERAGLAYWVPLAAVITAVELTGTKATKWHLIPWTTISTATGHLETKWHWFAIVVVSLIVLVVYLGAAYARRRKLAVGRLKPVTLMAAQENPSASERAEPWRPGSLRYDVTVIVVAIVAGFIAHDATGSKFVGAFWVYGIFIGAGIVLPSAYAAVTERETTLFGAIRSLEWVLPWGSYALIAGMAVLAFHLALYPWPNVSHQSPDITNGTTWQQAETAALNKVSAPDSYFAVAGRGTMGQADAWIVTLYPRNGGAAACVFEVDSASQASPLGSACP